ncbi:hypothetical protein K439DRAFT_1640754, partial [Ramaria rubella]
PRTSSSASTDYHSQRQRHHHRRCDGRGHYAHMKRHHVPLVAVLVPLILGSPSPPLFVETATARRATRVPVAPGVIPAALLDATLVTAMGPEAIAVVEEAMAQEVMPATVMVQEIQVGAIILEASLETAMVQAVTLGISTDREATLNQGCR